MTALHISQNSKMTTYAQQIEKSERIESYRLKMNDCADLYHKSSSVTKFDAINFLEKYKNRIKWKKTGDRSIDIGCAEGGVTTILESYLPSNYESLIGCDLNERMVKHANQHYASNRLAFKVFDIEGDLTDDMLQAYDHVFSFYTLQWIRNQRKAFQNIYDMAVEGGDCFLTFLAHTPVYCVYQALARTNEWSIYLKDLEYFVSPYHDCQEPDSVVYDIMENIGFKNIDVKNKQLTFVYKSVEAFKNLLLAVNPFSIPQDIMNVFKDDLEKMTRELRLVYLDDNNVETVRCKYNLLVVYAQK